MKVRNIVVNGKKVYLDMLIRELIKYEINYVLVENYELHFQDNIIRLYELSEVLEMDDDVIAVDLSGLIHETNKLPFFIETIKEDNYKIFESVNEEIIKKDNKPKYTKRLIKEQNRRYNSKINTRRK